MVCKGGGRNLKATYFLMYQGYERVANMAGGIDKWASKASPVKGDASSLELIVRSSSGCCEATSSEVIPFRAPTSSANGACC
jgi:hypothetical protein